jgi:hypothetical protein
MTMHYSGKPDGTLVVQSGDYRQIDVDVPDPTVSGRTELHMLYANCALTWRNGDSRDGWIQVKYVREGGDDTGYQTYTVARSLSAFLITATHWEESQRGVGGRWQIKCGGGLARITLGTRYCKAVTL